MRLTGSRMHLAVLCSYAFRPDVDAKDSPQSAAAALGSEAHAFVEAKIKGIDTKTLFFQTDAERIGIQVMMWLNQVGDL